MFSASQLLLVHQLTTVVLLTQLEQDRIQAALRVQRSWRCRRADHCRRAAASKERPAWKKPTASHQYNLRSRARRGGVGESHLCHAPT